MSVGLTIADEVDSQFIVLVHQSKVQRRAISNLVVNVVEAPGKQDVHRLFDFGIFLARLWSVSGCREH